MYLVYYLLLSRDKPCHLAIAFGNRQNVYFRNSCNTANEMFKLRLDKVEIRYRKLKRISIITGVYFLTYIIVEVRFVENKKNQ